MSNRVIIRGFLGYVSINRGMTVIVDDSERVIAVVLPDVRAARE